MIFQKNILSLLEVRQRLQIMVLFVLMLLGMVFEMVGIGLVLPIVGLMTSPDLFGSFSGMRVLIDWFGNPDQKELVFWGMIVLALFYGLKNGYLAVLAWAQSRFIFRLHASLSQRLFTHYLCQPYIFHLQHNSAQLIRNIVVEVNLFTNALQAFMVLTTELLVIGGVSVLLLFLEPYATLIVLGILGLAATLFYLVVRKRLSHWGKERQHYDGKRIQLVQEGLGSVKEIKLLGRESDFLDQYRHCSKINAQMLQHQHFLQQVPRLWLEVLAIMSLVIVILALIAQGRSPTDFLPTLGLFCAAAFRLMPSINRCLTSIQSTRFAFSAVNTLHQELFGGAIESKAELAGKGNAEVGGRLSDRIELSRVNFRYPGSESQALCDISLTIPRGISIGFIGESGAGKSTLVDIVLGLLTPSSGAVLVDGVDIRNTLHVWQNQIGYVSQTIFLTDDTMRRNVAFGLADVDIDESAVWKALRAAQLEEFVRQLPEGLDTEVGERGVRLSGGQRQRIGIARALYHDPSVLVLDEATSALDTDTESSVMEAIRAMHGEKTILIITHRLSAVAHCDLLIRLAAGRIFESKTTAAPAKGKVEAV
jgi:ABC-type multidrug transport system fused ATPase/permease subunit